MDAMNEQEAKDRCAQLAAEHPDRASTNWIPVKQKDGAWAVARIGLPPPVKADGEEIRANPPTIADDPRDSSLFGNLPPGWYGA
jgi:hypothetical protein